ncbi:MAG: ATP-binding protein [Chloroflexi bacterium]|nr:ATP-binding protein [Chloroflexota bacterium]
MTIMNERIDGDPQTSERVGRVVGIGHTSSQEFRVVLDADAYLAVDDLVVVRTDVPGLGTLNTYGVVVESEATYEGASYESDVHRIAGDYSSGALAGGGLQPAAKVRTAQVAVTRVDPEVWIAPDPGEEVFRARGIERDRALYADEMRRPLAIGCGRDGEPVYVDLDFFDGTKGGHMSIAGVSGVATKTTFAFFFVRLFTGHPQLVGASAANTRVLVFNVKGEDLLYLDQPSTEFSDHDAATWRRLGVEPTPFGLATPHAGGPGARPSALAPGQPTVAFWAPPRAHAGDVLMPDVSGRSDGIAAFHWTPREFIDEDLLQFVFTDATDARNQIPFVEERVRSQLKRLAVDVLGAPGAVVLREPNDREGGQRAVHSRTSERVIRTLRDLAEEIATHLEPEEGGEPDFAWSGRVQGGTVSAFMRRLHAAAQDSRLGRLVRDGESHRIDRRAATVSVVAIQNLHDLAQRFVVGALLRETFRDKEETGQRLPLSIVVLDELNKYAPREGQSPLKEMLIDIAQRGRSLGVLMIGAQQSASRVAPDVLENASIRVTGRLDAAESERAEFGWMLPSTKARARLLKPGTMVLGQPAVPVPIVLNFPRVPWATRADEVRPDASPDPFRGLV